MNCETVCEQKTELGVYLPWFSQSNEITGGLQPGQIMAIAGYAGECKTTLCLNIAYNASRLGKNVGFITLEGSGSEIQDAFSSIHSSFQGNSEFPTTGSCRMFCPQKQITLSDCFVQASKWNNEIPLDVLIIDDIWLLDPEPGKIGIDARDTQRYLFNDLKICAVNFGKQGIPVITTLQITRVGKEAAEANENRYEMKHLGLPAETQRVLDFVIATRLGSERYYSDGFSSTLQYLSYTPPSIAPLEIQTLKAGAEMCIDKLPEPIERAFNFISKRITTL